MSKTAEIAERLKALREITEISIEEMCAVTGVDEETYVKYEEGEKDFSVTFLYNCASKFGVDVTALLTGHTPKLSSYSIVRAGQGVLTERRHSFRYEHLAQNFRGRTADPFFVTVPYDKDAEEQPIALSTHKGQEMDYVLEGELKIVINGKTEILKAGDTAYYDSGQPHGMIAIGGKECKFIAIVLRAFEE